MAKKRHQRTRGRSAANKHPLVGLFFHTFHDVDGNRTVQYQGFIKEVSSEGVLAQLLDGSLGRPRTCNGFRCLQSRAGNSIPPPTK